MLTRGEVHIESRILSLSVRLSSPTRHQQILSGSQPFGQKGWDTRNLGLVMAETGGLPTQT